MDITAKDLPSLVGKVLVVQVSLGDEDFREATGKCLAAAKSGFVIKTRTQTEIIEMADVIDVEIKPKPRRLSRRWIGLIDDEAVRQHLLDRHGLPFDLVKHMDESAALAAHKQANHSRLGHEHGEKPMRRAGRPKKEDSQ